MADDQPGLSGSNLCRTCLAPASQALACQAIHLNRHRDRFVRHPREHGGIIRATDLPVAARKSDRAVECFEAIRQCGRCTRPDRFTKSFVAALMQPKGPVYQFVVRHLGLPAANTIHRQRRKKRAAGSHQPAREAGKP